MNKKIEFKLVENEHGYDDYDVLNHDLVKRICVGKNIKKGDLLNTYWHDGSKHGSRWQGSLETTLSEIPLVQSPVAESSTDSGNVEYFPGACREEVGSILMQDVVGDYATPEEVPEWAWVEQHASFNHCQNGQYGVWEFVLNLNVLSDIPARLVGVIKEARERNLAYLIFHQGT